MFLSFYAVYYSILYQVCVVLLLLIIHVYKSRIKIWCTDQQHTKIVYLPSDVNSQKVHINPNIVFLVETQVANYSNPGKHCGYSQNNTADIIDD